MAEHLRFGNDRAGHPQDAGLGIGFGESETESSNDLGDPLGRMEIDRRL